MPLSEPLSLSGGEQALDAARRVIAEMPEVLRGFPREYSVARQAALGTSIVHVARPDMTANERDDTLQHTARLYSLLGTIDELTCKVPDPNSTLNWTCSMGLAFGRGWFSFRPLLAEQACYDYTVDMHADLGLKDLPSRQHDMSYCLGQLDAVTRRHINESGLMPHRVERLLDIAVEHGAALAEVGAAALLPTKEFRRMRYVSRHLGAIMGLETHFTTGQDLGDTRISYLLAALKGTPNTAAEFKHIKDEYAQMQTYHERQGLRSVHPGSERQTYVEAARECRALFGLPRVQLP